LIRVLPNRSGGSRHPGCRTENESRVAAIKTALLAFAALCALAVPIPGHGQIANTKHNLTPSGAGTVRANAAAGSCVFCHTPHNASSTRSLWNATASAVTYTPYASSTQVAKPGQPTGTSRQCLSCHDGTTALGNLRAPNTGAFTHAALTGNAALGTNLSDDHPVSFVYDGALAAARGGLVNPVSLPSVIRLDATSQLQCTSCHEPHSNQHPNFLRMDMRNGALCTACHRLSRWPSSTHATSTMTWNGVAPSPWPSGAFPTVAENGCASCHRPHAAGHGPRLLAQSVERANCTVCHNGHAATKNIEVEFSKPYRHPVDSSDWIHDPKEEPAVMPRHVACEDCHNPHATTAAPGTPSAVPGSLKGVKGVTRSGATIAEAVNEYEVCFKCHGMTQPTTIGSTRQSGTRNIRLRIDANNASYHPVEAAGKHPTMGGLVSPYTASSVITCADCHNNNAWTLGGPAPKGPHGSTFPSLLERPYMSSDPAAYSTASYALCFKCHSSNYLSNGSKFPHSKHNAQQASCAVCHDAHGSSLKPHLIDFMTRDRFGKTVVTAYNGTINYTTGGPGSGGGTCTLTCHGQAHNGSRYP